MCGWIWLLADLPRICSRYLMAYKASRTQGLRTTHWLAQGLQQLHVARRILGFSYVFAFYMFDGVMFGDQVSADANASNQNLFEDAQARMESEVRPEPCPWQHALPDHVTLSKAQ